MSPKADNMVLSRLILALGGGFFVGLAIALFNASWSNVWSQNPPFDTARFGLGIATLTLGLAFLSRASRK